MVLGHTRAADTHLRVLLQTIHQSSSLSPVFFIFFDHSNALLTCVLAGASLALQGS
jgi:hypothetical protein